MEKLTDIRINNESTVDLINNEAVDARTDEDVKANPNMMNASKKSPVKKSTVIVASIVSILIILVCILGYLNWIQNSGQRERDAKGVFLVKYEGKQFEVNQEMLNSLVPYEITANYKKSGKAPVPTVYKGVPLVRILEKLQIDTSKISSVSALASDGYASAITGKDALDPDQAFIAFEQDGKNLGNKADGGSGPMMMILAKDQFSQRWVKYLSEIQIVE